VRPRVAGRPLSKLLFFATEDWFVRSHFLPLLRRARADGFEVVVAARESGALAEVKEVRIIDTPFARGSMRPGELGRQIAHLRELLGRERPDVVHAIALKPMALLALSGYRDAGLVFALTGRGYLGVRRWFWWQAVSEWLRNAFRNALRRPRALLLVENTADRDWLSSKGDLDAQTLLMPGAGVNPDGLHAGAAARAAANCGRRRDALDLDELHSGSPHH
jgi:hypothetical protein